MSQNIIKVGFCVAYDWELLKISIPRVYEQADILCLSIDSDRNSWSGKKYDFNETDFFEFIKSIDKDNKIKIYEDNFFDASRTPLENDNYQRNKMAEFMGEGGWHIQVDADEYFLDFNGFVKFLLNYNNNPKPTDKAVNICVNLIPFLKKVEGGYIYVHFKDRDFEIAPFATNRPEYVAARRTHHFDFVSNSFAIHETWSRDEKELWNKINNWGHRDDFNKESYYKLWLALDPFNHKFIKDFHPIQSEVWPALGFCKANNIEDALRVFTEHPPQTDPLKLLLKNSRFIQRIKSALS